MLISITEHLLSCGFKSGHHHHHPHWTSTIKNIPEGTWILHHTVRNVGERKVVISNLSIEISVQITTMFKTKHLSYKNEMKMMGQELRINNLPLWGERRTQYMYIWKPMSWSSNTQHGCIQSYQFKHMYA